MSLKRLWRKGEVYSTETPAAVKNVASDRCIVFKYKPISAKKSNAFPCLTAYENALLYF